MLSATLSRGNLRALSMTTNLNLGYHRTRAEHVDHDDWENMPPDPPDLTTAVKDYLVWMKDASMPLDHRFQAIKSRIVCHAITLVEKGKV